MQEEYQRSTPPESGNNGDQFLFDQLCRGVPDAVEELLLRRCGPRLKYLAWRFEYEDLGQDLYVWLRESDWTRLKSWRGDGSLNAWVIATATRLCLQRHRATSRLVALDTKILDAFQDKAAGDPLAGMIANSRRSELLEAIERLPNERQRQILRLTVFREPPKTTSEVAELLKITENNLFKLKHDAIKKLRQLLAERGWGHA